MLKATIQAFLAPGMPRLLGIALAVPPDRVDEAQGWNFGIPCWIVPGGATRQDSVESALFAIPTDPDAPVMIHDGVRPFPPADPIHEALKVLEDWDGALLGEASTDTLKRVDETGRVLDTVPRESIFRAQTPQVARLSVWRKAFATARAEGFQGTDDASLLEQAGLRVKMVLAPSSNLKLTTQEDWERGLATVCGKPTHA